MARISATFVHATATIPLFFTLAPPRHMLPFLVRVSGALALKVVQVPSTGHETGDRRREKEDIINYDVRQEMVLCSYVWKI